MMSGSKISEDQLAEMPSAKLESLVQADQDAGKMIIREIVERPVGEASTAPPRPPSASENGFPVATHRSARASKFAAQQAGKQEPPATGTSGALSKDRYSCSGLS